MAKLIPSPVTSIEEQATGQVPVSHCRKFIYKINKQLQNYENNKN